MSQGRSLAYPGGMSLPQPSQDISQPSQASTTSASVYYMYYDAAGHAHFVDLPGRIPADAQHVRRLDYADAPEPGPSSPPNLWQRATAQLPQLATGSTVARLQALPDASLPLLSLAIACVCAGLLWHSLRRPLFRIAAACVALVGLMIGYSSWMQQRAHRDSPLLAGPSALLRRVEAAAQQVQAGAPAEQVAAERRPSSGGHLPPGSVRQEPSKGR